MDEPDKILNGGNSLRPQKRIFLGLLALTCLLFTLILGVLWYVPYVGLTNISPELPLILGIVFSILLLLVVGSWSCWPSPCFWGGTCSFPGNSGAW